MNKKLYTPTMTLKEIVIQLALIIADTNPGYDKVIEGLIEEMDKWGLSEEELSSQQKGSK